MTSPRLDLGTLCVLDTCDNQLHHEACFFTLVDCWTRTRADSPDCVEA